MRNRREFLGDTMVTLVFLPVGARLAGCGSSTRLAADGGQPSDGGRAAADGGQIACGVNATSTVSGSHVHTVCVPAADLASPPAAGVTYTTSFQGHAHTVTLTQAELQQIQGGGSVAVTTSSTAGHTHDFTLSKASAAPEPGPGGYP